MMLSRWLWTCMLLVPCVSFTQLSTSWRQRRQYHESPSAVTSSSSLLVDGRGMAGGSQHLLGDIIRSLQPRYLSQVANAVQSNIRGMPKVQVDSFCRVLEDKIPSWQELERQLQAGAAAANANAKDVPSASATIRLFGRSEQPVVTLYRDSAAWCPYCQKVWIALEEKQIPYQVVKIDMRCYGKEKPTEFLRLQPNGNLPCAVFRENGKKEEIVRESNDIIDELDRLSESLPPVKTPNLRPQNREDRIRDLCDNGRDSLERRLYTRWMWWLTGVRRPEEYKELFLEHWQEVEDALAFDKSGPYFLGKDISVVDIRFIPFIERELASLTYFKGADYLRDATRFPNIVKWLETMESRLSYQATKSDYYTHSRALPPQLAADCVSEVGACEDMQAKIDSWPVGDGTSDWVEPGWDWSNTKDAPLEAATKLIQGKEKIAQFSARGAGIAGIPAASAPLADPAAKPNETLIPGLDLILRFVASSLLEKKPSGGWLPSIGGNSARTNAALLDSAAASLDGETREAIAQCLDYLRERIGIPRDVSYPAAQELRRELLVLKRLILLPDGIPQEIAKPVLSSR